MAKVQLECEIFKNRVQKVINVMGDDIDGVMLALGKREDSFPYGINAAMFLYLLGYEFPETVLIIRRTEVLAVTSAKKSAILEQLKDSIPVRSFIRMKDGSNQESINNAITAVLNGKPLGILKEERGTLVTEWENSQKTIDVTERVEQVFLEKDEVQKDTLRLAGISATHIAALLESKIKQVIKTDDRVIHEEISEKIEADLEMEIRRLPKEIDQSYLELCFKPVIQSGGRYLLERTEIGEFVNPYNDQLLYFDIISYYLWVAYKGYCSLIGRTFLVSPNEKSVRILKATLALMEHLVKTTSTEKTYKQLEAEVRQKLQDISLPEDKDELALCLKVEIGKSIGVRPAEGPEPSSSFNASPKDSMVFVVSVKFEDVSEMIEEDNKSATVHMENIILMENGAARSLFTFSTSAEDYILEKTEEKTKRSQLGRRIRNRDKELERANEINEHQKQLMDELIEEQLLYYKGQTNLGASKEDHSETKFVSYQKETQIPRGSSVVKVDKRVSTVIVPVFGMAVPFHIGVIKNATKTVEDGVGYLKLAFYAPSSDTTSENNLLSLVVKDSQENITTAWKEITGLKKEEDLSDIEDVEEGEQEELQVTPEKIETLQHVYIRFDHRAGTKKTVASTIELHKNGLRYYSKQIGDIDILFSKVKHMFYQAGAAESPTLIHFKLHTPIVVNDKKTMDVQFFRDCTANAVHDTRKTRNRMGEEEAEMYEEEEEERMREEINDAFHEFAEKISRQSRVILEEPLTKGFYGVPHKQSVLIQPTAECLVNLSEFPFFVLPFKDIEILNFERRITGVTTCDLVFVLKEKSKPPVHVYGVSSSYVAWLMDFFDSKNICFTETKVNIQWSNVLKSVLEDPVAFYEGGGWAIIQPSRDIAEEEEDSESEAANLETSEDDFSDDEDFATDDDSVISEEESEEDPTEEGSYAESGDESENDSFIVDDEEEEEAPKKKKQKK